jgi:hypothetical protein
MMHLRISRSTVDHSTQHSFSFSKGTISSRRVKSPKGSKLSVESLTAGGTDDMARGVEPLPEAALKLDRPRVVRGLADKPRVKAKLTVKLRWLATRKSG